MQTKKNLKKKVFKKTGKRRLIKRRKTVRGGCFGFGCISVTEVPEDPTVFFGDLDQHIIVGDFNIELFILFKRRFDKNKNILLTYLITLNDNEFNKNYAHLANNDFMTWELKEMIETERKQYKKKLFDENLKYFTPTFDENSSKFKINLLNGTEKDTEKDTENKKLQARVLGNKDLLNNVRSYGY